MKDYYIFPAVLEYGHGKISVYFPDIPGCKVCDKDIGGALSQAKEALGRNILAAEKGEQEIPAPSDIHRIKIEPGNVPILVDVFMPPFRERGVE